MFDANLKKPVIDDPFGVFLNITVDILDNVNDTQFYMPGLTFVLVLYVYNIIGEGKIWKYLLGVTFFGLLASAFTAIFNAGKPYFCLDYLLQLKWFETIFWHFNEFGYVYISYLKLQIVVPELHKAYWKYILGITFVYNFFARLTIAAANVYGRKNSAGSHLLGYSLIPLAIIELVFMFLIIKTFIKQSAQHGMQKNIVYTMLTSSLTRMFLVGLIYFLSSCVCYFYSPPILKVIKNLVFRCKSSLGVIFLMDLLFIRIDIREQLSAPRTEQSYLSSTRMINKKYDNNEEYNRRIIENNNNRNNSHSNNSYYNYNNNKSYEINNGPYSSDMFSAEYASNKFNSNNNSK